MNYSKIKSIKPVESRPIYHLSVEENSNFFANNLCVHNCYYRNDIIIILFNPSNNKSFIINEGDRIAQGVLQRVDQAEIIEIEEFDQNDLDADRGGGFGSTGI